MSLMSTWGVSVIISRVDGVMTPAGWGIFSLPWNLFLGLVVELSFLILR